ncbi:MAG: Gfo/Idh/MocA family oxidoreductase [Planctomycetota bacterium]
MPAKSAPTAPNARPSCRYSRHGIDLLAPEAGRRGGRGPGGRPPGPSPAERPKIARPSGRTKVAVVGAGYIADFHLEILSALPDVDLVAVCDVNEGRARSAAEAWGAPHAVTEIDDLAGLGVDVAHLAVPPDLHVALTRRLLESGVGVFAEKPIALSTDDARALAELADERGLALAVNHNNVYHPAFARLVESVQRGDIGRVEHVQVTLSVPLRQLDAGDYSHWMFRAPRNIVFEQAVHPLSQVEHLLGGVRSSVVNRLKTTELLPGQTFYQRWSASFTAERGTAELYMAFGEPFTRSTLQVLGSDGSLEADLFHDQLASEQKTEWLDFWNSYLAGARRGRELKRDARRGVRHWSLHTLGLGRRKDAFFVGMRDSMAAFHRALRAGDPLPNDAWTALRVTEWADALAGDASAEAPPVPDFPDPGEARENEVVVLGGNGFIGRRVVDRLLERGENVTCVVRRVHSLPPKIVAAGLDGQLRIVRASLGDEEGMAKALAGAKRCIHLATGGGDTWEDVQRVMVDGSVRVAEQCVEAGVERLVYVSSIAALYTGTDGGVDAIADSWDTDPQPDARPIYSRGKAAAEKALREVAERTGLGLVVARPGVVLGEGTPMQHSGLGLWVRDNHCVGWGRGDTPLPLVLADDVADGLVAACLAEGKGVDGKAINLSANPGISGRDAVEELAKATGRKIAFHSRSFTTSQAAEIGKWLVKRAGRRKAPFPSYRDLKSRALATPISSDVARDVLGWKPVEDREEFLDRAIRIYGRRPEDDGEES